MHRSVEDGHQVTHVGDGEDGVEELALTTMVVAWEGIVESLAR